MRKNESGFTLIELMIVIAIIAIIAAIAIPNLLSARLGANETGALGTLRNLATCQAQFQTTGKVDCDSDGQGEFGTFCELTGKTGTRKAYTTGTPATTDFSGTLGAPLNPASLSAALGNVNPDGAVTKSGYAFVIFLPDSANTTATTPAAFCHEKLAAGSTTPTLALGTAKIGVDLSETTWCAYAQPVQYATSGLRVFFTNQSADVYQSSNEQTTKHQGAIPITPANSAFLKTGSGGITGQAAVGSTGQDNDKWRTSN